MTEKSKRWIVDDAGELIDLNNHKFIDYGDECCNLLNELAEENKELKIKNDLLSDELEQAKAVINKKWSEYLKKKME